MTVETVENKKPQHCNSLMLGSFITKNLNNKTRYKPNQNNLPTHKINNARYKGPEFTISMSD